MPKFDFYPSFNAGEVSPFIDARTTLEKYRSACRTLENFQILPYGGAVRRPGFRFVGQAKRNNLRCRLIGFNFSTATRFIIECGEGYMRFWKDGILIVDNLGDPVEVITPYDEASLRELQFAQVNDIMYFTHARYPVHKLSRYADDDWEFETVNWLYPPLREINISETTIRTNALTGTATLTATTPIFQPGHVDSQWRLEWRRNTGNIEVAVAAANNVSTTIDVKGGWDLTTYGTWNAEVQLLRIPSDIWKAGPTYRAVARTTTTATVTHVGHGYTTNDRVHFSEGVAPFSLTTAVAITVIDADSYSYTVANSGAASGTVRVENLNQMEIVREYDSNGDRNIITSGNELERAGLKLYVKAWTSHTNARVNLTVANFTTGGQVRITAVAGNGLTATAEVEEWLGTDAGSSKRTTLWYEGSFSTFRGFPRAVALHEQRLCFAAVGNEPTTIWASALDDFENFELGTNADNSLQFSLAASEGNRINWMYSQSDLLVGTSGDEWTVGSADTAQSLSATNIQARRQSSYGSKYMKASLVNDVLLFVQRNGRKVRELVYELNKDGWIAPDLTLLAEHITQGEIVELAYQQQPDAILWCVRGDGTLIAMTYERDQKVVGWHRHVTDGTVESVATIYGVNTEDEVWVVVRRVTDGFERRYLERFQLGWRTHLDNGTTNSWRYLDSFTEPTNTFSVASAAVVGSDLIVTLADAFNIELAAGDLVTFAGVGGMTQLNATFKIKTSTNNNTTWTMADPVTNADIDATGWSTYTSGGTATFTNLYGVPNLSGKSVVVYRNDGTFTTTTATTGRVVSSVPVLAVGLTYTSTLRPMKLDMELQDGTSQGRKKRVHQILARTYKSRGGQLRTNSGDWYDLNKTAITTGDQKVVLAGAFGIDADIDVRQTEPYPFCLLALEPKWDAYGNE
jgi:hypothetical protein